MGIHRIFSSQELFLRSSWSESLAQTQKTDLAIKILQNKGKKNKPQTEIWTWEVPRNIFLSWTALENSVYRGFHLKLTEENSQYPSSQFCYGAQCRLATHFYFKKPLLTQSTQHFTGVLWKEHSHSPGNPREFPSLDSTSPLRPVLLWGLRHEAQWRFVPNFRE